MKCPYCNEEMEYGLIQSSNAINWLKTEKRRFFFPPSFYRGSITLSTLSMLRGSAVVAYNCRTCKKLVIDYGDPASDLNYVKTQTSDTDGSESDA